MGRVITAIEAARLSGLGEKTIRRMLADGRLPATKDGHDWAIDSDVLLQVAGGRRDEVVDLVEQLRSRVEQLELRVLVLEGRTAPASSVTSRPAVDPLLMPQSYSQQSGFSKKKAARLSEAHGAKFSTAEKWRWPVEALQSAETVLLFARSAMGNETWKNWHECVDAACPCHVHEALRQSS